MKANLIHLAVAFDQNYVTPFYVLITSIFQNNKQNCFHIHAIISGVSEKEKEEIHSFTQQYQSDISFYSITPDNLEGLVLPKHLYFTIAAYYRLFFPLLVPENVQKLLYLDTDIVVLNNLSELYNTDIEGYPVGAVAEVRATKNRPDLGIHEVGTYFNSGVMLMNIPEWKKQRITEKALQFLREFPEKIIFVDQDALNVILINNYIKLNSKFNILPFDIPRFLVKKKYQLFLTNKVIIHYTLPFHKPWKIGCASKFRHLYYNYLKQSPRSNERKHQNSRLTLYAGIKVLKVWSIETVINLPKVAVIMGLLFREDLDSFL